MALLGSLSWAISQRALWLSRANNAWGSSRVYGSGSSFETDSATWQGRANTAYDSGTWGVGNTWQADYNAVLPPASPIVVTASLSATPPVANNAWPVSGGTAGLGTWSSNSLTLNKTGHYVVTFAFDAGHQGGTLAGYVRKSGVQQGTNWSSMNTSGGSTDSWFVGYADIDANSGDVIDVFLNSVGGNTASASAGTLTIRFVPTSTNAH
jgi:hypothetical protein